MTLITKKRLLWPYLALYLQFSQCTLLTKATPTNYTICHDFNCHINERETPKTCLTNHKGSILHHITPLVINSLGGGHTHTHTYMYTDIMDKSNFKKPALLHWYLLSCITKQYLTRLGFIIIIINKGSFMSQ